MDVLTIEIFEKFSLKIIQLLFEKAYRIASCSVVELCRCSNPKKDSKTVQKMPKIGRKTKIEILGYFLLKAQVNGTNGTLIEHS